MQWRNKLKFEFNWVMALILSVVNASIVAWFAWPEATLPELGRSVSVQGMISFVVPGFVGPAVNRQAHKPTALEAYLKGVITIPLLVIAIIGLVHTVIGTKNVTEIVFTIWSMTAVSILILIICKRYKQFLPCRAQRLIEKL